DARVPGHAGAAAARIAVVDRAVAVVVLVVALLHGREQRVTQVGQPVHAEGHGVEALADAAADGAEPVVDGPVAVVVLAVADLVLRQERDALLHVAAHAVLDGHLALAHAAHRGAEPVVGGAVAVLVLGVAALVGGQRLAGAHVPLAAHAHLRAALALAD